MTKSHQTYTTGQVAQITGVSPRTVVKWIDRDKILKSYKVPGSGGHRRIMHDDLYDFLMDNYPLQVVERLQ